MMIGSKLSMFIYSTQRIFVDYLHRIQFNRFYLFPNLVHGDKLVNK